MQYIVTIGFGTDEDLGDNRDPEEMKKRTRKFLLRRLTDVDDLDVIGDVEAVG
jgi:hypothetical protein